MLDHTVIKIHRSSDLVIVNILIPIVTENCFAA